MSIIILLSGIFVSILIRSFFVINGTNVADIKLLFGMGEALLKGTNPYLSLSYNSYPPVAIIIQALTILLSNISNIPFHILVKFWPNLADILITIIIYKFLVKLKIKPIFASFWSLFFILNPISIIISSAHGQLDSVTSLFVILSIYLLTPLNSKTFPSYVLPALFLGLAIAIKPNPLMLLPFFLFYQKTDLKQKITLLIVSIAPLAITLAPYILQNYKVVLEKILGYQGVYDSTYAAVLRGFWYQQNADYWLPYNSQLLNAAKLAFGVGVSFLVILFAQSKNLIKAYLGVYLLFLGVYFGISVQYLSWILPLAILAREKMVILFSITGTLAFLGFYTFFGPDILFGRYWNGTTFQSKYMLLYFFGNLVLWITILWWFIKIVKGYTKEVFNNFSPLRKKITIITLSLFIVSLFPILRFSFIILSEAKIIP